MTFNELAYLISQMSEEERKKQAKFWENGSPTKLRLIRSRKYIVAYGPGLQFAEKFKTVEDIEKAKEKAEFAIDLGDGTFHNRTRVVLEPGEYYFTS